ncbi:hypothetical protein BJ170DRAFT_192795 [Xylariales sp. AK1849]|nr:hypothetical protein BJ170DRAFT_192795 [Xylariales sp. AK1849]
MMPAGTVAVPNCAARARGLSIKTNLPVNNDKGDEMFSQLTTAPAHKLEFTHTEAAPKHEMSKALLNDDWRHKWRPSDDNTHPPQLTLAPENKFSKAQSEVAQKNAKTKLRIDTLMANDTGQVCRIRNPKKSPLDPDFILSAPATKKEYSFAGNESYDGLASDVVDMYSAGPHGSSINLGPKHSVFMNLLTPTIREGFDMIRPTDPSGSSPDYAGKNDAWSRVSFVSTPSSSMNSAGALVDSQFPWVQIQAVKTGKRLQPQGWNHIDTGVKKAFAELEAPRTAGLPVEKERHNYETRKQAVAMQGVLNDTSIQSIQVDGQTRKGASSLGLHNEQDKGKGYNSILAKLHKASAHRLQANDPAIVSVNSSAWSTDYGKQPDDPLGRARHGSNDSAISGLSTRSPEKASTLNPKASQFLPTVIQKRSSATFAPGSPSKFNRPSVMGFFEEQMQTEMTPQNLKAMLDRIAFLESQVTYLTKRESRVLEEQKQAVIQQLNATRRLNGHLPQGPMLPPNDFNVQQLAMRGPAPTTGLGPSMANNMPALPIPGLAPTVFNGDHALAPPLGLYPNPNTGAPLAPPPGFSAQGMNGPQMMPPLGLSFPNIPQPGAPASQRPITQPVAPASTPVYIHNGAVGPKPVSKPKGPPRAGDPAWGKGQQEYEAYLEWRRTQDPKYHQECKERQIKRAERRRSEREKSDIRAEICLPGPKAPLEIRAPTDSQVSTEEKAKENVKA